MAKRNQKPEVRKAQREQAVRAAKDQKKATVKKPAVKVHATLPSNERFSRVEKKKWLDLLWQSNLVNMVIFPKNVTGLSKCTSFIGLNA